MRMLLALARLAMALWIGAIATVSFVVAPRVFSFLDDHEQAGKLMVWIFQCVDYFGIGAGLLFALAARRKPVRSVAVLMAAAAAANVFVVTPKIVAGTNTETYHMVATGLWSVILVAGVILIILGPGASRP